MSKPNLPPLPHYLRKTLDSHQEEYVTAYAEEAVRPYIEALERIAAEEFISLGEGNVDVLPALSDREACNLARAALMGVGSPGHKPAPVDTSSGHGAPVSDERARHDNWYSRTHMHEYSRDATWRGWQARAALASAPVAGEYTSAMGEAAQTYMDSFRFAHKLPAQFRWADLWTAMHGASQSIEAVRNEDVATLLNFTFEHFGKPFNACDLPGYVLAAMRRLERAALSPAEPRDG